MGHILDTREDENMHCDYDPCSSIATYRVHAKKRMSYTEVCGRHLAPEIKDSNTFDDPVYAPRHEQDGVKIQVLENR